VRQRQASLGESNELHGSRGGVGEDQTHGIGETDVLARENDEPPREEPWTLAASSIGTSQ